MSATATEIAPDVFCLGFSTSNAYLVGPQEGPWILVDSGIPGHFEGIRKVCEERFGKDSHPEAIVLTHGHLDHCGSALPLATYWDVPIYAHRMELPYLTGRTEMPPSDPAVGGAFSLVARFMPPAKSDLGSYIHALPEQGTVPGMPDWEWKPTPGHTPGHVSLFRAGDRTLLAGDAVLTVNADDLGDILTRKQEISHPPAPATYDWIAARRSMRLLASLRPNVVASGHGIPMSGPEVAEELAEYAEGYIAPLKGRYISEPARFDENGIVFLPPPAPDPLPRQLAGIALGAAAVGLTAYVVTQKRRKGEKA